MWNTSNILSLFRLFLVVPTAVVLWRHNIPLVVSLYVIAGITDVLDGFLARKLHQISDTGKIVDPLADKVFVGVIAIILVLQGKLPEWFVISILARDAAILLAGIYAKRKTGIVLPSNYVGKAAVVFIGFTGIAATLGLLSVTSILLYIALALMVVSLFLYTTRWLKVITRQPVFSKTLS